MADVFISYAREDRPKVEPIARAIESSGLSVWWDRRIAGGSEFARDIERELVCAGAAVVCWSKASVDSRWVRDEASAGAEQGKLVPVLLDGERAPMGFRQFQAVDLSRWDGGAASADFAELLAALHARCAARAPAPAEAAQGSIAVLPFSNLSGDAMCQHFCDGVGADIIALLARNKDLNVLARGASFSAREPGASVAEIGRRLNVRYVIDGTVRRSETNVRITADLVLSSTGQLLWSGQSDGPLKDVLSLQDDMARHLASVVAPELGRYEREAAARKAPDSLTAWECAQRGCWHLYKLGVADLETAERWFSRAVAIDDGFAHGHAGRANAYVELALYGARAERGLMLEAAMKSAGEAVRRGLDDAYCRLTHARALAASGRILEAIEEAEAAIVLNPSSAHAWLAKGWAQACRRDSAAEAVATLDRAIAMSPQDPLLTAMHGMKTFAHLMLDDLAAAELSARRAVRQHNATHASYAGLAAVLGLKGSIPAAGPVLRQLRERAPAYSCADLAEDFFFIEDQDLIARLCEGLRAAGAA